MSSILDELRIEREIYNQLYEMYVLDKDIDENFQHLENYDYVLMHFDPSIFFRYMEKYIIPKFKEEIPESEAFYLILSLEGYIPQSKKDYTSVTIGVWVAIKKIIDAYCLKGYPFMVVFVIAAVKEFINFHEKSYSRFAQPNPEFSENNKSDCLFLQRYILSLTKYGSFVRFYKADSNTFFNGLKTLGSLFKSLDYCNSHIYTLKTYLNGTNMHVDGLINKLRNCKIIDTSKEIILTDINIRTALFVLCTYDKSISQHTFQVSVEATKFYCIRTMVQLGIPRDNADIEKFLGDFDAKIYADSFNENFGPPAKRSRNSIKEHATSEEDLAHNEHCDPANRKRKVPNKQ